MKEMWIRSSGEIHEDQITSLLGEYCGTDRKICCAFYTNKFQSSTIDSGQDERLAKLLADRSVLLEIRLFDSNSELRLYRSMIGQCFSYRIADDCFLREKLASSSEKESTESMYRMEQVQVLDIDAAYFSPWKCGETDAYASRLLRTTGGGVYNLPIQEDQDAVIVISYIHYDPKGVASIADTRMAGFCNVREWRMKHENR